MKRLCLILVLLIIPLKTYATATPRNIVVINRPVVKLKDLFYDAGAKADRVIGSAPPPGKQFIVGPAQLQEIASRYDVPVHASAILENVVVKRAGAPVPEAIFIAAVKQALGGSDIPRHAAVSLTDFRSPIIPPNISPTISLTNIFYNPVSSTFSGVISIVATGMNTALIRVTGLVRPARKVVIATHALRPGIIVGKSDVAAAWVPITEISRQTLTAARKAYGKEVRHSIPMGLPIPRNSLVSPKLVNKGAFVTIAVKVPGLEVETRGIALGAGARGSIIAVLNPVSHDVIQAVVTARNQAQVDPDSTPLSGPSNNNFKYGTGDNYYTSRHRS